jgi:hypothetical protein
VFASPAWLARIVTVPDWPMLISSLFAVSVAALPAARATVTGSPRFEVALSGTGTVANFNGRLGSGVRVIRCSAFAIVSVALAPPV